MKLLGLCLWLVAVEAGPCNDNQQCASCDIKGQCLSNCNRGYYGYHCKHKCSSGCKNKVCHLTTSGNGECTFGCELGFYSSRCNIPCEPHTNTCRKCPQECEEGFCQLGSSCAQGCQDSYYGTACKSCPDWCEVCNRVSGTCEVCLHCEGNCSQGCTEGCSPGYFGDFCEHNCNSGCLSGCNQTSGYCTHGCSEGWYGLKCETKCQRGCHGGICTLDGTCADGCKVHFYGKHCENRCSASCLNRVCDAEDGTCQSCEKRFYGSHCNKSCVRCKESFCTQDTGQCSQGCTDGWYGPICESKCPRKCVNKVCGAENGTCDSCEKQFYGSHCEKSCEGCVGGSCTQDTGQCSQECLPNYKGKFCQHYCGGNCTTEECFDACKSKTKQYWIGGISLIFIVFLVIVVYVTYHFKRIDNNKIKRMTWHAETGTVNVEQEDSSSLSESDCSQMGVQVVILKQPDAESIVSLDDQVVDKAVADRELLKKTIVEENLPSVSYKVSRLDVAGTKDDSVSGQDKFEMNMEQFGNTFAHRKIIRDDEKEIASCSGYFSGERKAKMRTILEKDVEYERNHRKTLREAEKEERIYFDSNFDEAKTNYIVEDNLVDDKKQIVERTLVSEKSIDDNNVGLSDDEKGEMTVHNAFTNDDTERVKMQDKGNDFKDWHDKGPDCFEGASAKINEILGNKDFQLADHVNDDNGVNVADNSSMIYVANGTTIEAAKGRQAENDRDMNTVPQLVLDVPDNSSMTYDGIGTTIEASKGRQPENAGAINTKPQLGLDVTDNSSMTYDGNGTKLDATTGRQPESAEAMNTEPQLAVAQVNVFTEQIGKTNQSGIVRINENDNDKHYVEVFLMND